MSQSFNNKYITQILLELDFAYFVEDQSPSIYNHGLKTVNQQKETKDNIIHSLIYKTKEKEHFDTMYRGDVQPWTRRKIMLKNGCKFIEVRDVIFSFEKRQQLKVKIV